MATGNWKWFPAILLAGMNGAVNLGANTLRVGLVTTATTPALSTADPRWGAGGTTNFSSNQVSTAGTSYTGPIALASKTWTLVSNVPTLRATDITVAQDGAGPTNIAWGILYDDTSAGKYAIAYLEISAAGSGSLQAGQILIDFQGAGTDILTLTQS